MRSAAWACRETMQQPMKPWISQRASAAAKGAMGGQAGTWNQRQPMESVWIESINVRRTANDDRKAVGLSIASTGRVCSRVRWKRW
jgi:hypothetical protein